MTKDYINFLYDKDCKKLDNEVKDEIEFYARQTEVIVAERVNNFINNCYKVTASDVKDFVEKRIIKNIDPLHIS